MDLPFIDEHRQRIDGAPDVVWAAMSKVLSKVIRPGRFSRALECEPVSGVGKFEGQVGDALAGFRVIAAEPGRRLVLRGRHRFARYQLTFRIKPGELSAETRAAFPGVLGKLYRAAVIGTGGHRIVTRNILRRVARAVRNQPSGRDALTAPPS